MGKIIILPIFKHIYKSLSDLLFKGFSDYSYNYQTYSLVDIDVTNPFSI